MEGSFLRTAFAAVLGVALYSNTLISLAAPPSERMYGKGAPFEVEDLPPGLLRQDLESLPESARGKAMRQLHSFSFPQADAQLLRADSRGGIFVADTEFPQRAPTAGEAGPVIEEMSAAETFSLHSRPGASKVIYLDFDGHVITGTAWNDKHIRLDAKPFDVDGDPTSFNADELNRIAEVWHRIAEDFAPFDVDVTTEAPASFGPYTGRLLMTEDTDINGKAMPAQGAGGVAYVNVFGASYYQDYSPALVYVENLSKHAPFIAEAASHEMGHNLGLTHDGVVGGSAYYSGHGSGAVSWGPVMGTGYNDNVSQWSKGEYTNANNTQDDLAIMDGKLGMRGDDHADTFSAATLLAIAADGVVTATHPENDPFNTLTDNKGIINTASDVDMFGFSTSGGQVALTVTPSWAAWARTNGRGTNLDVEVTLYDLAGNTVATVDPLDETNASLNVNLVAGSYYLGIRGVGNTVSPYSDYNSQGQYFITGNVPVDSGPADTTAPNPDPMSFASLPAATGTSSIAMTATVATDDSGGTVQYFFECVSGGSGCTNSGWQTAVAYEATGLQSGTNYSWRVRARDLAGNMTTYSSIAEATTDADPTAEPPAAPGSVLAADNADGTATISWADNSNNETSFEVVRESWHAKRNRWRSTTLIATTDADVTSIVDASGNGLHRYRVRAVNGTGSSAYSAWVEVTVTTAGGGGGGGNGGCKGGPKKCG